MKVLEHFKLFFILFIICHFSKVKNVPRCINYLLMEKNDVEKNWKIKVLQKPFINVEVKPNLILWTKTVKIIKTNKTLS